MIFSESDPRKHQKQSGILRQGKGEKQLKGVSSKTALPLLTGFSEMVNDW